MVWVPLSSGTHDYSPRAFEVRRKCDNFTGIRPGEESMSKRRHQVIPIRKSEYILSSGEMSLKGAGKRILTSHSMVR